MLLEHELYYGSGMDVAPAIVCSWNRNVLEFRHGCPGYRMLLEHEHCYDLGMDTLVIAYT